MESRIDEIMNSAPGLVPEPAVLYNEVPEVLATTEPENEHEHVPEVPISEISTVDVKTEEPAQDNIDEYGNEVQKKERVYTQSEVEAMMRDRNRRGEFAQQQTAQQPPLQHQEQEGDDWEAQLETFIDSTLSKREQKKQELEWQRQEQENQSQFEIRFNQGMAKYSDFEQVVVGKPLTPQMVIATRGMQDPAAFIYAAAKHQAPELERISRIQDPISQVVELGRLEERMRKARGAVSQAPRPIDIIKGDITDKVERKWSIDDKLRQAEDAERKDRMQGRKI